MSGELTSSMYEETPVTCGFIQIREIRKYRKFIWG